MANENHRTTSRILDLLELLARSENGYTLTELAEYLQAPKSSIFPIIHTLENREYVEIDPSSLKYRIGFKVLTLTASYDKNHQLLKVFRRKMQAIVDRCDETCQLGVLSGNQVQYLEKIDSSNPIRLISYVGTRLPAYCTSLGKALLSNCSLEQLYSLYPDGLKKVTEHTITDFEILYDQLVEIHAGGIAMEREEVTEQLTCFSVPIKNQDTILAAISVSIPLFRADAEKCALIRELLQKAKIELEETIQTNHLLGNTQNPILF